MKPNKILLIITLLLVTPLIIMSSNNEVEIVDSLDPIQNTKQVEPKKNSDTLDIGDSFFDIKVKVPYYNVTINSDQNVVVKTKSKWFMLDYTTTKDIDNYDVPNTSKIIKIDIIK